ncbi:MAG: hypothetical protein ACLGIO_14225 [Acidimicrobiia bacterium]
MSAEAGHNYTFGSPRGGWPSFGPDGRRVREDAGGDGTMPDAAAADDPAAAGPRTQDTTEAGIGAPRPAEEAIPGPS